MERWDIMNNCDTDNPLIDAFLGDIHALCMKYNLSLSHEDGHGAFIVESYSKHNIIWLSNAHADIEEKRDDE